MTDILIFDGSYQSTGPYASVIDLFFQNNILQSTSQACIVDLTPPVFAGITALEIQPAGQLRASWLAGFDVTLPVRYEVYVQEGSATGLFHLNNIIAVTDKLQYDIFNTPDGALLEYDTTYYVGVRAIDGVNNRENNTVSLYKVATGITVNSTSYEVHGVFSIDSQNRFVGSLWGTKNAELATGSKLGQAKYTVYRKDGTAVVGMSQNNISADSNGLFVITPITSLLNDTLDHYIVQVQIVIDGALRTSNISIVEETPEYAVNGVFSVDTANNVNATFWATADDQAVTASARLGTASYQVYNKNGVAVVGMSQSGITADANGFFIITPVTSLLSDDLAYYSVKVTISVDGVNRMNYLPIMGKRPTYELKGAFSLTTANQLRGTIWAVRDSALVVGSSLGTASYQIYNRSGATIAMSESGITANADGQYIITPINSLLSQELDHYMIKVTATVDGVVRSTYISVIERIPTYDIGGIFTSQGFNSEITASLWGMADGQIISDPVRLGTASYQIYDSSGVAVASMNETGIAPNVNGVFIITPKTSALCPVLTHYSAKVTVTIDGITRIKFLPIAGKYPLYECKGQFSISASNTFQATLWATIDGIVATNGSLGHASYQVYDVNGAPVSGLTQSGLVADANGRFNITPVSATILTDLTHYSVKISIEVNGTERTSYKGFTLLGN